MNTSNTKNVCTIIILSLTFLSVTSAKIIYVDDDANGLNTGTSWSDAYRFLQDALVDANSAQKPVEIRVAAGVYKPDRLSAEPNGTGDRTATFRLINGVMIKGGYAGFGEADPNARDITKHETILSGDLAGNDVDVIDPCDLLKEPSRAENSYHVVTGSRANATALLDGFMITAGYADGWESLGDRCGGGMLAVGGSPIVKNCTFKANRAMVGGGMCNWPGYPKVTDCSFEDNSADQGGGMFNRQGGPPTVANCKFSGNWAYTGGGMSNYRCGPGLTNCTFMGNSADGGGGIYSEQSGSKLANCVFRGNNARIGGAMLNNVYVDTLLDNCIFNENSAEEGGGMYNYYSSPALSNCIFTGNLADRGKAVACDSYMGYYPSKIRLVNSILWDGGNEVWNNDNSAITVTYSNIQDGWFGAGNINVDPCFAEPNKDDYHLKSQAGRWEPAKQAWIKDGVTSPCIDAGDPASPIGLEPFPNGGIINMGAYGGTAEASKSYFGKPVCGTIVAGDINGDCIVNLVDFAFMAFRWLEDNNPHGRGDGR